tara:strand:+ start:249 stop:473 length:225 start_codon:yes stop_codon:yes gene_type:complete
LWLDTSPVVGFLLSIDGVGSLSLGGIVGRFHRSLEVIEMGVIRLIGNTVFGDLDTRDEGKSNSDKGEFHCDLLI